MILVVSRNEELRAVADATSLELTWAEEEDLLRDALTLSPTRVLVDLNLDPTHHVALRAIEICKERDASIEVIAFLHEQAGREAILASLAGADRVIPQSQLLDELPTWS